MAVLVISNTLVERSCILPLDKISPLATQSFEMTLCDF